MKLAFSRTAMLSRAAAWCLVAACGPVLAAEIRVLSAGAVEPGVRPVIEAFERSSGHHVRLQFATAPQIADGLKAGRIGAARMPGDGFDLLIAPPAVLDLQTDDGSASKVCGERVAIGGVGLGVAVRSGAPQPDIASVEAFTRALREADTLVYNRASTGLYLEGLLKRLDLADATRAKTTRYADGAAVMAHIAHGHGHEIGLGAITEILLASRDGVQFVGPLPPALQNTTVYLATLACAETAGSDQAQAARALLQLLATPAVQANFRAAGISVAR